MAPPGGISTSPEVAMDIKPEARNDSGSIPIITSVNVIKKPRSSRGTLMVKKEDPGENFIDLTLSHTPELQSTNTVFDPFDGSDDDSALSDLDGFDEEYVDDSEGVMETRNGVQYFVCRTFEIPQISAPVVLMRYVSDLFACLEYGSIILDPDYQREVVWDEHRASMLICSILMGYFVPPIIFNHKMIRRQTPEGEVSVIMNQRICVDGKQRLTALRKFMSGQIGILDKNQRKWYFCHPVTNGQESYSNHIIMPAAVKNFFKKRTLCCYEYNELPQETEENMFQLVQRGIALTPAEKMRAKSTEWAAFAKQYEEDYSIIVNLSKQNRASGFRIVLTIFAMILETMGQQRKSKHSNRSAPTLQASPQALERLLEDKVPINTGLKLKFKEIFDRFETLVKACSDQLTATKYRIKENSVFDPAPNFLDEKTTRTFSPVELVGTAVLVSYHMATRSDFQLLKAVKDLRRHLRIHFKDLRLNAQCWSSVWEFIRDLPKDVSVSPECKKSSRQTLGEEVQNEEDEDPWAPSPYLKAATQAGEVVDDFDKRTTRSQATRPGLNNRPEKIPKTSAESYRDLSPGSSATADDSDVVQSAEEGSSKKFVNLQVIPKNTIPVVEIPCRTVPKLSKDMEIIGIQATDSAEGECMKSSSEVKSMLPNLGKRSPGIENQLSLSEAKANQSPTVDVVDVMDGELQASNTFLDLTGNHCDNGTTNEKINSGKGACSDFSTGVFLLEIPNVTEQDSQNACHFEDFNVAPGSDFKPVCRSVRSSLFKQHNSSCGSIAISNIELAATTTTLAMPAPSATELMKGDRVAIDGIKATGKSISFGVPSRVPETLIHGHQNTTVLDSISTGNKDGILEIPSGLREAAVSDTSIYQDHDISIIGSRSAANSMHNCDSSTVTSGSSDSEAPMKQTTKRSILPQHHYQKFNGNISKIPMADILVLAENKPKVKSRFKPKAPLRVSERRPEGLSLVSKSTPPASRPNMTTWATERPAWLSPIPKRSPGSPACGESSMKKLKPEDSTSYRQK